VESDGLDPFVMPSLGPSKFRKGLKLLILNYEGAFYNMTTNNMTTNVVTRGF
jgi:hypothetical protein